MMGEPCTPADWDLVTRYMARLHEYARRVIGLVYPETSAPLEGMVPEDVVERALARLEEIVKGESMFRDDCKTCDGAGTVYQGEDEAACPDCFPGRPRVVREPGPDPFDVLEGITHLVRGLQAYRAATTGEQAALDKAVVALAEVGHDIALAAGLPLAVEAGKRGEKS